MNRLLILICALFFPLPAWIISGHGRWRTPLDSWYEQQRKPWTIPDGLDAVFTPNGKSAAIALQNGTVTLFRLRDQKKLAVFDYSLVQPKNFHRPICLSFSPDGSRLAVGFKGERTILITNIRKQKLLHRIRLPFHPARIRFSPLGRYLLASDRTERSGWRMVYSFFRKKLVYTAFRPVPCTFSRNDRYFFIAEPIRNEWRISMIESGTGRRICLRTIPAMGSHRPPLTLRSLRDHRILIGFQGLISIGNRFLTAITASRTTPGHDNGWILPLSENDLITTGGSGIWKVIQLHSGKRASLNIPAGSRCLHSYPKGHALLYIYPGDSSIRIKKFSLNRLRWSQ